MGKRRRRRRRRRRNKGFIAHSLSKILEDILKGYFPFLLYSILCLLSKKHSQKLTLMKTSSTRKLHSPSLSHTQ
jgi:hypothetical protein